MESFCVHRQEEARREEKIRREEEGLREQLVLSVMKQDHDAILFECVEWNSTLELDEAPVL